MAKLVPGARKEGASRKPKARTRNASDALRIGLHDPGMTPLLRAGVGGLAASLRAIRLEEDPNAAWPSPVCHGSAEMLVEATTISITFNSEDPADLLKWLCERSFVVRNGLIHLPGAFGPHVTQNFALGAALQNGLKRTFLQHGKSTTKDGAPRTVELNIEEAPTRVSYQPYTSFVHQGAFDAVLDAIRNGSAQLAGWVYPGNAGRHNGFKADTDWRYTPAQALAGIFAIVGCLSYEVPRSGGAGALVIVEPSDLVQYAITRVHLTPASLDSAHLTGIGDAVLAVHLALRAEKAAHEPGVASVHGVTLRATPWASQQKSRVATISVPTARPRELDLYEVAARTLPAKLVTSKNEDAEKDDEGSSFFVATSALRSFVTDNIARGRVWFEGFSSATTPGRVPRFIHYYRARDAKNLGALYPDEREGLIAMIENLEEAELALVRSVQQALRQRFGAIADDTKKLPKATRDNRFTGERDKWRLAFSGAKTPDQVRAALADLWSRAGSNSELQRNWRQILPLLRPAHWQVARDLSLVALASYARATSINDEDEGDAEDTNQEGED